jgi:hypothetical protein
MVFVMAHQQFVRPLLPLISHQIVRQVLVSAERESGRK